MSGQSAAFHCWHATSHKEALRKGEFLGRLYGRFLRDGLVVDLGCGEGAILLWLREQGRNRLVGVESNVELSGLAESFGVPVVRADLLDFLRNGNCEPGDYLCLDVIEHVPFESNLEIFRRIPVGSRLIIQTPNTQSLLGHEFYMNVPSHIAPYSPHVIWQMLDRCGYTVTSEGTVTGNHPPTWKNKLRALFIRKVLAIDPEKLLGGGNYYVVADRVRES